MISLWPWSRNLGTVHAGMMPSSHAWPFSNHQIIPTSQLQLRVYNILSICSWAHLPLTCHSPATHLPLTCHSPATHLPLTCHSPARQLIRKVSLTLGSRKEHAPHLLFSLSWCGFEGYGGEYCQGTEVSLLSALPVLGNINPGQWTYFSIILLADGGSWQKNGIQLAFAADGGQPALLAKRGQYPTFADNDVRSLTQQGTHLISPNFEFK